MATVNLGRVKPIYRGEYDPGFPYQPLDFLAFEGSTYFCLKASQGNLPSNAEFFQNVLDPKSISIITRWESLTGNLSVPYITQHLGQYWMLRFSVPDVTAHEPGVSQAWARIADYEPPISQPSITAPADGVTDFIGQVTLSSYATSPRFTGPHERTRCQAATDADFTSIVEDTVKSSDLRTWTPSTGLPLTQIWLRCCFGSGEHWSDWTPPITVTTPNTYVAAPNIIAPADGEVDVGARPILKIDGFQVVNGSDVHIETDWIIRDSGGSVVWQSLANANDLLEIPLPAGVLEEGKTYTPQARVRGDVYGQSALSPEVSFTTSANFGGIIGEAGKQGFGVGVYPGVLSNGMVELTETTDDTHANYGNYMHQASGSIMVFVPRYYYRIGATDSPRYAKYGDNAIDIAGIDQFADEAAANAAGYAMPRAFIDGGQVKHGFFRDKYLCSPAGSNDHGISIKDGVPISLVSNSSYTNSGSMTGCAGELHDAITLSRARGPGFNCELVFMVSATALLSLAHAQAATSATHCAWFDGTDTTNYPKGCNSSLADVDDAGVTFTTAGDSGNAGKPKTGSGSPFAKTTHNGQESGIADVNGAMWQVALGITSPGSTATSSAQIASGDVYVLKESAALADLTAGHGGTTDAWGTAGSLANNYDSLPGLMPWGSDTGNVFFGSGANQVFDGALSGDGWLRTACGLPQNAASTDATGTNLFGQDQCYRYNTENMFVQCAGYWGNASNAGVFYRLWSDHRTYSSSYHGFRASLYMD